MLGKFLPFMADQGPPLEREKRLWQASMDGELETVTTLTKTRVDVNWVGVDKGDTPLHRACRFGHLEVVKVLLDHRKIEVNKGNQWGATPFFIACQQGHKAIVLHLLADPRVDVVLPDEDGTFPFNQAAWNGQPEVVSLLLYDSRIDPNSTNKSKGTALFVALESGRSDVAWLLLSDPRTRHNLPDNSGCTPLWMASQNGHLPTAQLLFASERSIDTKARSKARKKTAEDQARWAATQQTTWDNVIYDDPRRRQRDCPLIADLICEYELDPEAVRRRLRQLPEIRKIYVGHLFALVVFFSDGFLRPIPATTPPATVRFLRICSRLPLDLQMVICNRMFGSPKNIVSSRDSEPGFKWIFRIMYWLELP